MFFVYAMCVFMVLNFIQPTIRSRFRRMLLQVGYGFRRSRGEVGSRTWLFLKRLGFRAEGFSLRPKTLNPKP